MTAKKTTKKTTKRKAYPSTKESVRRALDVDLTEQVARAGKAIFGRIERLADAGEDIPISLLGAARLCSEWHTDYLTVMSAMPDLGEDDA